MTASSEAFSDSRIRPDPVVLNRVFMVLALLGLLDTWHLGIQEKRGFDQGCLGFTISERIEAAFDCEVVVHSGAGSIGGVSNVTLGMVFYGLLVLLSLAVAAAPDRLRHKLLNARSLLTGAGLCYTVFLVFYQTFVLEEYCALCLISAMVVVLLSILEIYRLLSLKSERVFMKLPEKKREIGIFAGLCVLAILVGVADTTYFNRIEVASTATAQPLSLVAVTGESTPSDTPAECSYDPDKPAIENYASLVGANEPVQGDPGAKVTVIEYFEPNCGHCAHLAPVMEQVVKTYGDRARFVFKPVVFWPEISERQVEALYAAAQKGKFFDMMKRQFELQQRGGLSEDQLRAISTEIGLDPNFVSEKIKDGSFDETIKNQRKTVVDELKIRSVPTVLINGKVVSSDSKTIECFGQLIDAATK